MKQLILLSICLILTFQAMAWTPKGDKIKTQWGETVTPENAWRTYPRPQLKRTDWQNLNGLWKYAIIDQKTEKNAVKFTDEILVPFAIESSLSGVAKTFTPNDKLWYQRSFTVNAKDKGKQILLHFGAVDYACQVWVNNKLVGSHTGGNNPFSFNITSALKASGIQTLELSVVDPTDYESITRGKQQLNQKGIWYTPVSGIWQTVWFEAVNNTYINSVLTTSDIAKKTIQLNFDIVNAKGNERLKIKVLNGKNEIAVVNQKVTDNIEISIPNPVLWSLATPKLYTLQIELLNGKKSIDKVESYFAMREVKVAKDNMGYNRVFLNGKPVFQYGTLDQGWWPDGLLTPPSPEAMIWDMIQLKEMGFNTIRKHIKVEPALYYYYADSLGIMLWQDMPSGFATARAKEEHIGHLDTKDWEAPASVAAEWRKEFTEMITNLRFFSCITTWVVFNEGWGQHNTVENVKWAQNLDKSRIINGVTGWTDRKLGDMYDVHNYPVTSMIKTKYNDNRISALGEFGGLGLPLKEHLWNPNMRNWGYKNIDGAIDLATDYARLMYDLETLIAQGLGAAIYTQTTDVEGEVNGLITYDRKIIKLPAGLISIMHSRLYNQTSASAVELIADAQGGDTLEREITIDGINQKVNMPYQITKASKIKCVQSFKTDKLYKNLSLWLDVNGSTSILLNGVKVFESDVRNTRCYNQFNISNFSYLLQKGENTLVIEVDQKAKRGDFDFGLTAF